MSKKLRRFLTAVIIAGLVIFISQDWWLKPIRKAAHPVKYGDIIAEVCGEQEVDPALCLAVIKTESGFREDAVSPAGAIGLMQITPETMEWLSGLMGEDFTENDLLDAEVNIRLGVLLLKLNIERFGMVETALAAYNAGRSRVAGWLQDGRYSEDGISLSAIPYEETENYVRKVMEAYKNYTDLYYKYDEKGMI